MRFDTFLWWAIILSSCCLRYSPNSPEASLLKYRAEASPEQRAALARPADLFDVTLAKDCDESTPCGLGFECVGGSCLIGCQAADGGDPMESRMSDLRCPDGFECVWGEHIVARSICISLDDNLRPWFEPRDGGG
jgi:hypothetical protein